MRRKGNKMKNKNKKASSDLGIEPGSLAPPCPMTSALDHSATTTHRAMVLIVVENIHAL